VNDLDARLSESWIDSGTSRPARISPISIAFDEAEQKKANAAAIVLSELGNSERPHAICQSGNRRDLKRHKRAKH
jgi:hypothetical protein